MSSSQNRAIEAQWVIAGAAVCFGLTAIFAKLAAQRLGGSQVALVRFAICALPLLAAPRYRGFVHRVKRWDLLIFRGILGAFAVLCFFHAVAHIPAGVASLLNCTSPIFAVLFARIFLGETFSHRVLPAVALATTGVVFVVGGRADGGLGALQGSLFEFVALASAVFAGAALAVVRAARRTESSWAILAVFSVIGLVVTAPLALPSWTSPTAWEWGFMALVGILSLAGQLAMTWAFRWVDNLRVGVIGQLSVVVSMVLGMVALGDVVRTIQLLGGLLTLAGVIGVIAQGVPAAPAPGGSRRGL